MARGGASRGGGGGGRSSGGGGGRSFGGRSGGGGFNRGGVSSGGGFSRGGSSFGGGPSYGGYRPPPRRAPRGGMGGLGPAMMGYSMGRSSAYGGGYRRPFFGGGGCGCLVVPIVLILVVMVLGTLMMRPGGSGGGSGSSGDVTASTIEREALPKGAVNETGYYTDELGWIGNQTTLTAGMKNFYQQTGVQPYLYLTDTINGSHSPTEAQVEQFANDTYDALFTDEAHMLLIFFEYGDTYNTWYLAGVQAKTVLDDEAMDILLDYVDKYYFDSSLTDEQMFSKAFDEAGERIMTVTTSPWIPVLIVVGVLAILVVVFLWWRSYKKQKNLEAEQTQKILDTPLETFGDTDAEERAKKYNGDT